jgi:hypothetical protein
MSDCKGDYSRSNLLDEGNCTKEDCGNRKVVLRRMVVKAKDCHGKAGLCLRNSWGFEAALPRNDFASDCRCGLALLPSMEAFRLLLPYRMIQS